MNRRQFLTGASAAAVAAVVPAAPVVLGPQYRPEGYAWVLDSEPETLFWSDAKPLWWHAVQDVARYGQAVFRNGVYLPLEQVTVPSPSAVDPT